MLTPSAGRRDSVAPEGFGQTETVLASGCHPDARTAIGFAETLWCDALTEGVSTRRCASADPLEKTSRQANLS